MSEPQVEPRRCPNCGAASQPFEDGLSCGWRCEACEWCVATTNPRLAGTTPPRFYVWVTPSTLPVNHTAVAVAAVLGVSISAARAALSANLPIARAVDGTRAEQLRIGLISLGVGVRIAPTEAGGSANQAGLLSGPPNGNSSST